MGLLGRLRDRWRAGRSPGLDVDDPALVVVATAFDDTEAASAALARAERWRADEPAVLRHHLVLPQEAVERARELLAQDDWRLDEFDEAHDPVAGNDIPGAEVAPRSDADHEPGPGPRPETTRETTGGNIRENTGDSAPGTARLVAVRVQKLDALHCAQERSRMASLAQRLGGDALGWDALQLPR
ncbi:hypothetical protein [Streptoalloteichus hindustanus]|uniref:Uncharacterized protein n=1 Tax=Streptoalloteichus hindustanus TaxID=2017 RepID=A0A1M5BSD4_STRHI|nr:hypothetical protein [Streptoalloteichus hindustanus]SHF45271.1 hypothetical protein SAMN05444320_103705 [Streptoalloteichus hindustanus]